MTNDPKPTRSPAGVPRCASACPRYDESSDDHSHQCYLIALGDACAPQIAIDYQAYLRLQWAARDLLTTYEPRLVGWTTGEYEIALKALNNALGDAEPSPKQEQLTFNRDLE